MLSVFLKINTICDIGIGKYSIWVVVGSGGTLNWMDSTKDGIVVSVLTNCVFPNGERLFDHNEIRRNANQ